MQYEIKKIDLWSTAKFVAIFYGLIGLVPMFFGLMAFLSRAWLRGFSLQALAMLLFPLGALALGFIVGLIFALIYNWVAEAWGGIKINIDYSQDKE